jgi:hypothetical protein
MSNMALDVEDFARILKVSTSPAGIKYKFGIQAPEGIKNSNDLDKKNGNQLWEEDTKTELNQLKDYPTFIVVDSGGGYSNRLSENSFSFGFWCQKLSMK